MSSSTNPSGDDAEGTVRDVYLQRYYSARFNASLANRSNTTVTDAEYAIRQRKEVLKFSYSRYSKLGAQFTQCADGELLGPQKKDTLTRECVRTPIDLKAVFSDDSVHQGHREPPEDCPRFSKTDGCVTTVNPEVCIWTWMAEKCDDAPPGLVTSQACSDTVYTMCETWLFTLNTPHPTYNCDHILEHCWETGNADCLALRGQYLVTPSDWSAYVANDQVLSAAFETTLQKQHVGLSANKISLIFETSGAGSTLVATVCITNLPTDWKPLPSLRRNTADLLQQIQDQDNYDPTNGISALDFVAGSWGYLSTSELTQRSTQNGYCGTSVPAVR